MCDVKKTVETLKYQGDSLLVRFTPEYKEDSSTGIHTYLSPEFCLSGSALVQAKIEYRTVQWNRCLDQTLAFIRCEKLRNDDKLKYILNFVLCKDEESENSVTGYTKIAKGSLNSQSFGTGQWTEMYRFHDKLYKCICLFDIDLEPSISLFASYLNDGESSETIEVCGKKGSVYFNQEVLMVISKVLRTMLKGDWKEAQSHRIELPDTTKETLEHLKDYIYLQKLPTTGLVQLLLLANYLNMQDLEDKITFKILGKLNSKNAHGLLKLAFDHDFKKMLLGILELHEHHLFKASDMDTDCKELP